MCVCGGVSVCVHVRVPVYAHVCVYVRSPVHKYSMCYIWLLLTKLSLTTDNEFVL